MSIYCFMTWHSYIGYYFNINHYILFAEIYISYATVLHNRVTLKVCDLQHFIDCFSNNVYIFDNSN